MERPASIVIFERCYLGAWILGLINTALNWNTVQAQMANNPSVAQLGTGFASTMAIGGIAISAVITLTLWYFTARQGSGVARWIVTIFYGLGVLFFLYTLLMGRLAPGLPMAVTILSWILQTTAVVMLFRPDSRVWFGEYDVDSAA
jgi:hypothetical protein